MGYGRKGRSPHTHSESFLKVSTCELEGSYTYSLEICFLCQNWRCLQKLANDRLVRTIEDDVQS